MFRMDYTKDFYIENLNAQYTYEIGIPMAKLVFAYVDELIKNNLKLKRRDSFGNHTNYTNYSDGEIIHSQKNYDIAGRSFIGWYGFDNNDNDILILSVHTGITRQSGWSDEINPDECRISELNNYIPSIQVSLFYSRTLLEDGVKRSGPTNYNIYGYENETPLDFFGTSILKDCGIRVVIPITYIQENNYYKTTLPIQLIKNGSSTFFTFNNSEHAIPRIGVLTISSLEKRKAFIHVPPYQIASNRYYYVDDYNIIGDNYRPKDICVMDNGSYPYGTTDILKNKYFYNIGNKVPTMPIFLGTTDAENPTELDFSKTIDGFYQINKNFENQFYTQYVLNNTSFTNLGNCLLMKD